MKCDEQYPTCRRCVVGRLECHYPQPKRANIRPAALLQPATYMCPDGISPECYELDIFGTFRSSMVAIIGGSFNHLFWKIDVPTAAQIYPSLWHAAIALTAIYKSVKVDNKPIRPAMGTILRLPRNHLYVLALEHFNKSIQHLAKAVAIHSGDMAGMRYRDKEMILLTHLLYIGLCGMLSDDRQITSQCKVFSNIVEAMRFGDDGPTSRSGIVAYEDLLSVILVVDNSVSEAVGLPNRWHRSWTVKCPSFARFTTITQAYISLLPTQFPHLLQREEVLTSDNMPVKRPIRLEMLRSFATKFAAFQQSAKLVAPNDQETLQTIELIMEASWVREEVLLSKSRLEAIKANNKFHGILGKIEDAMTQVTARGEAYSEDAPLFIYAPSFGMLLQMILEVSNSPEIYRTTLKLLKRWPYNETNSRTQEEIWFRERIFQHCLEGPERTKPFQKSGMPILSGFSQEPIVSDDYACECIQNTYICREHRLGEYEKVVDMPLLKIGVVCWYEYRHKLPFTWYSYNSQ